MNGGLIEANRLFGLPRYLSNQHFMGVIAGTNMKICIGLNIWLNPFLNR